MMIIQVQKAEIHVETELLPTHEAFLIMLVSHLSQVHVLFHLDTIAAAREVTPPRS